MKEKITKEKRGRLCCCLDNSEDFVICSLHWTWTNIFSNIIIYIFLIMKNKLCRQNQSTTPNSSESPSPPSSSFPLPNPPSHLKIPIYPIPVPTSFSVFTTALHPSLIHLFQSSLFYQADQTN